MKKQKKELTIRDFILLACYDAHITVDELREGKNARIIDLKRDIVMKLYRDERISLSTIAAELGYYDHPGPAKLIAGIDTWEYRGRTIRRGWNNLDIITDGASEPTQTERADTVGDTIFYFLFISVGIAAALISYFIFKS